MTKKKAKGSDLSLSVLSRKGTLIKCAECGHTWITKSTKERISCSVCGKKNIVAEGVKVE